MKDKEKTKAENREAEAAAETEETTAETGNTEEADAADPLQAELEACKAELAAEKEKYLRMAAEYDNYRRRSAKEREAAYSDAYADALMQIIPVIDNLERAAGYGNAGDAKQLSDGVNEAFGEKGDLFDPNIHNAIMHEEDPEQDESILGEVFQRGYRRGDKIIRCAMVKVIN